MRKRLSYRTRKHDYHSVIKDSVDIDLLTPTRPGSGAIQVVRQLQEDFKERKQQQLTDIVLTLSAAVEQGKAEGREYLLPEYK